MLQPRALPREALERLAELVSTVEHDGKFYFGTNEADGDAGFQWRIFCWEPAEHDWIEFDDISEVPEDVMAEFDPY